MHACTTCHLKPGKALEVKLDPPAPFTSETSAMGGTFTSSPQGYLTPGQTVTITVSGTRTRVEFISVTLPSAAGVSVGLRRLLPSGSGTAR